MIVKDSTKNFDCFKSTWRYFIDKGLYLILINLLPSALIPFVLSPSTTMYYLLEFDASSPHDLGNMFVKVWGLPFSFWYIGLIGIALLALSAAITFGVIDRHMRVGEFTVSPRRVKTRLNYNVLTAFKFVVVAFISLAFFNILATLLYYLWITVFTNATTAMVFCCLTLVVMEIGMVCTMSLFILWPPFMLHTGMKSWYAFKNAWSSMSGRVLRTMLSIIVVVLPFQIVMVITSVCKLGTVAHVVLDALAYAVIVPYYITLMYTTFYDVTDTERMDLTSKKKNIWSKK